MTEKVRYQELRPSEFRTRLAERPLAYLPLGTLEWHGEHLPLGTDLLISEQLMIRAAHRFGGIVLPALFLGPDRFRILDDGSMLIGMDYDPTTEPNRPLDGSCYWVPDAFFLQMIETILVQLSRAGFRAVFADGHGPSRQLWASNMAAWGARFDLTLLGVTPEIETSWRSQIDHAARNETSQVMAIRLDLVDLASLPQEPDRWPLGVDGEDPRLASEAHGEECYDQALDLLAALLAAMD